MAILSANELVQTVIRQHERHQATQELDTPEGLDMLVFLTSDQIETLEEKYLSTALTEQSELINTYNKYATAASLILALQSEYPDVEPEVPL